MKKLVLGALLAVASSAGCSSSSDSLVTVTWKFTHLPDNTALGCPSGFDTATIVSQATDDTTHLGAGRMFTDLFDCAAGQGTIRLPDDTYLVWVQIENHSGSSQYAQSQETFYDTVVDTAPVQAEIIDNGGFFFLTWDLVKASNGASVSCATAGSTSVEGISTSLTTSTNDVTDMFACQDHYGTTFPLVEGTYTVQVDALNSANQGLSETMTLTNKQIVAPNHLTDLGHLLIPITDL